MTNQSPAERRASARLDPVTSGDQGPGEPLTFPTACGLALHGHVFRPPGGCEPETVVVALSALAAPARYLAGTAAWLAAQGYGVLTFDYRGVGRSLHAGDPRSNLDDWGEDARAALRAARTVWAPRRVLVLAHSIGGMLLGHAGLDEVDGALLIGSTHGIPALYRGTGRMRLEAAYTVLPRIARAAGELPGWRVFFGSPVPRDVIVQWVRWGRERRFTRWNGDPSAPFAYAGPLIGVSITDDDYAPLPAVAALLRQYRHAGVRRDVLDPREHGARLGHFGLLRADTPAWARARLLGWLRELEQA